jgi:DNA topoisomerase IB
MRKGGREAAIREAVHHVAERLGNTPAVCRASYIDPRVLDRFRDGATIKAQSRRGPLSDRRRGQIEREVLDPID